MIALESFLTAANCLGELGRLRGEVLRHMISDLSETGNWRERGDAVRQLHGDGYKTIDIMILVDEAIWEIKQRHVAVAMSDQELDHLASDVDAALNGHPGTFEPHHQ